ncbi:hypothetical protein LCGC14_1068400 [marine sediment metagenome]|uniref:Uncharacterized protein n=1 Tax=marine sediment metagenome TaxID=412755 RepID=A0A0F9QPX8_9ZZZZ
MKTTNKIFFVVMLLALLSPLVVGSNSVSAGVNAAGTAANFADNNPSEALDDTLVTLAFDGLTVSADYVLVSTLLTNRTFSTGTGQTEKSITVRVSGTGSATLSIYGYGGFNNDSALDTWEFSITTTGDGDEVTNLYPLFIGVAIFSIIIGAIYKRTR